MKGLLTNNSHSTASGRAVVLALCSLEIKHIRFTLATVEKDRTAYICSGVILKIFLSDTQIPNAFNSFSLTNVFDDWVIAGICWRSGHHVTCDQYGGSMRGRADGLSQINYTEEVKSQLLLLFLCCLLLHFFLSSFFSDFFISVALMVLVLSAFHCRFLSYEIII